MASIHRSRTVGDQANAYRYSRLSSRPPEYGRGDNPYHRQLETLRKHGGRYDGKLDSKDDVMIELLDIANQSPTTTVSTSAASKSAEAWMQCAMAMKEHEEAKIEAWKEEIDTELVFAALFSAILTAFDVEAYKWLQTGGDNGPSVYIVTNGALVLNTTITVAPDPSSPGPSTQHAVAINALWFSGLICSVAAASLGILVRQWLNQYTSRLTSVSPDIARVRQFRRDNLKKWKVAEIMMLLPILLQGAVVLFLVGLVLFLHQLNQKITEVAAVLVALLLTFLLITTILPSIQDDCSYQSPRHGASS
ncbi:hypothetical protein C8Q70DRAFT_77872 [Cubamyces menziesii]|nr:hypothetical protein C8Q70DRAFT_77872 [Cubamyces menziesii]